MELLVVVDMQHDFIHGALGTEEAKDIVKHVINEIKGFSGQVVYTMDTHTEDYLDTLEGRNLPVIHCVKGSKGWKLEDRIEVLAKEGGGKIIEKPGFGSIELAQYVKELSTKEELSKVILIGLCTDICVISNAMVIKAAVPEVEVEVREKCLAGVTPESHKNALLAMKMCQIKVV